MQLRQVTLGSTEVALADGTYVLFSYKTPVAALVPGKGWIRTSTYYSRTTSTHIRQWVESSEVTEVDQSEIDALVAF